MRLAALHPARPWSHASAGLDLLLFGLTLAAAYRFQWDTGDLIWGLWLSSLTVGYSLILWGIWHQVTRAPIRPNPEWERMRSSGTGLEQGLVRTSERLMPLLQLGGGLFYLAFFTVHFGGFHLGHAAFLNTFFPLLPADVEFGWGWIRTAAAHLARTSWVLVATSAISARDAFQGARTSFNPIVPYANVIRMHLLIFFFAFAHELHWNGAVLYPVVLFAYFFPWRSLMALVGSRSAN